MTLKESIKTYLDARAQEDEQFARSYAKEGKTLDQCVAYIWQEVRKMATANNRCVAVPEDEVYGLAVHYYDEDNIKFDDRAMPHMKVDGENVRMDAFEKEVNDYELTEEEKQEARQLAIEREVERLQKASRKAKKAPKPEEDNSLTLFSFDE